ncbi:MAG: transposase [Thiomicrorhabdus sp.]|nr:transposase [Thiomicrorhabdus sp.]
MWTIYSQQKISSSRIKAYVLDDSIKKRRGKKMEGVSCHFDHTEGRHVMGQQVLTLGLVTEELFMPLDSQIYVSNSKVQGLIREFKDKRSIVAKRFDEAVAQSKPAIAKGMLGRSKRLGIQADYLVADAWFGTKPMIETARSLAVTAIFRMKKNKMKYRVTGAKGQVESLDANALYQKAVKGEWKKVRGMPYRAVTMDVELNIASGKNEEPNEINIRLLFVRGATEQSKPCVGKKDWALFLSTDPDMSMTKILEIYALRWGIEVYFKEAKQHLGFLKEQTWTFASHTASIHLTAIRYLMGTSKNRSKTPKPISRNFAPEIIYIF